MSNKLKLALPKGSLQDATVELFRKAGFNIVVSSRSYKPTSDDDSLELYLIRAQEIGRYVHQGFIDAGITRMQIVCATYAVCGMMDVMVGGLRGIGYSVMPMLVSLVGACGLRLVWIATIFQLPRFHTIQMLYWSYPVSWTITLGVHVLCFLWAMKRVKRHLLAQSEAVDPAAEMSEEPAAR